MPLFSVLSYNVHECVGLDKLRDPGRIARIISESQADVVGLQEVHSESGGRGESHQMEFLARATGFHAVAGPTLERNRGTYGNVLLTRHKPLSVRRLDLSFPGREPRGAIDADIKIGGETVRIMITHLGLRAAERRFQVGRLLTALSEKRTRVVVLLSDLNEWLPTSRALRRLQARFGKGRRLRTFPAHFPLFALDRIWVHPVHALVDLSVYDTPLSRVASDHLPLKAVIQTLPASSARPKGSGVDS